jgi:hypothetical protein
VTPRVFPFRVVALRHGALPQLLDCLAPSPAAALLIGRQAFPGALVSAKPHPITVCPFLA